MMVASISSDPSTPVAGASACAAAHSARPPSVLAPGFRFHPTDEELVCYYLKRKLRGRPFHFPAIAEIDLYKLEPWVLPAHARLQSRDQEWYFFSPLDRRSSNRSRTNRVTPAGYWKTTGKDRPVVRRFNSAVVGAKKTLVFHSGRAPNGRRTNWVMHEYRLEDEEFAREGTPQDTYVVCRIFQKKSIGSEDGAHNGTLFFEEDFGERADFVSKKEGEDGEMVGGENKNYLISVDIEQALMGMMVISRRSFFLNEKLEGSSCPVKLGMNMLGDTVWDMKTSNEMHGSGSLPNMQNSDGFFEVANKFVVDSCVSQAKYHEICLISQGDIHLHQEDMPSFTGCCTGQIIYEDKILSGASNMSQRNLEQLSDMLEPEMFDSCGFKMLDDLMEYFEATNDKLHYADLTSLEKMENVRFSESEHSNLLPKKRVSDVPINSSEQDSGANLERGLAPTEDVRQIVTQPWTLNENNLSTDAHSNEVRDRPLLERLTNLLNSISAPPAFAVDFPPTVMAPIAQDLNKHLTRLLNGSAMMVQMSDPTWKASAADLSVQKNRAAEFPFSRDKARNNSARTTRLRERMLLRVLKIAIYLVFLLALIFSLSFKFGICICTR